MDCNTGHDCDMSQLMEHDDHEEMMYEDEEMAMEHAEEMGMDAYHRHRHEENMVYVPGKNCSELMSELGHHDEDEEMAADLDGEVFADLTVYQV